MNKTLAFTGIFFAFLIARSNTLSPIVNIVISVVCGSIVCHYTWIAEQMKMEGKNAALFDVKMQGKYNTWCLWITCVLV